MKVINLLAAPSTGKTATGQILSGLLSVANYKVEYVPEFAKFATFSNNQAALSDQIYMFAKQENRLHVLKDASLDFVVMDGPLPIALLYQPDDYYAAYETLVMQVFNAYDNINFLLRRNPEIAYKAVGRSQNENEAFALDSKLEAILRKHEVLCTEAMVDKTLPARLFKAVTGKESPLLHTDLFD